MTVATILANARGLIGSEFCGDSVHARTIPDVLADAGANDPAGTLQAFELVRQVSDHPDLWAVSAQANPYTEEGIEKLRCILDRAIAKADGA